MVRIVFRLVRTHAVKLDSRRPYIQGEINLQSVRHKIFNQTFQTKNNVWTSLLMFIPSDPPYTCNSVRWWYYITCAKQITRIESILANTKISMRHFHEKPIFPWNTNIFIKHFHEKHIFPWNTNISMKHFHETKIFQLNTT